MTSYTFCHGLNVSPLAMQRFAAHLEISISDVNLIKLSGHNPNPSMNKVTSDQWYAEFLDQSKNDTESVFVGFSLGALLGWLSYVRGDRTWSKMILLAPPIHTTRMASLVKTLFWVEALRIPSFSPKSVRVHHSLSVRYYVALFELINQVHRSDAVHNSYDHISVWLHPKDELVDSRLTASYFGDHGVDSSQIHWVDNKSEVRKGRRHLMISPELMPSDVSESYISALKAVL